MGDNCQGFDFAEAGGFITVDGWIFGPNGAVGPTCETDIAFARYDVGGSGFGDGRYELDFTIEAFCSGGPYRGAGLLARMDDANGCAALSAVFCLVNPALDRIELGLANNGCNEDDPQVTPLPTVNPGDEVTISLTVVGNTARCQVWSPDLGFVSPELVLEDTSEIGISRGTVGFYAENAEVTVGSLRRCDP
jgi:hypothetical protein